MVAINDAVAYRSMGGDTYDATVTRVRDAGFVDVELTGPFLKEPFALTAVRWYDDPDEPRSGARPRRAEPGTVEKSGPGAIPEPETAKTRSKRFVGDCGGIG